MPTYYGKLVGYMLYACGNTKNSISFVWIFELVENKYKSACCSTVNTVDTLTMVVMGFYILFVSRNWFPIELAYFCVSLVNYICMLLFMPESPKWLLINGHTDRAIAEFNYIAKVNGSSNRIPETAQFIEAALAGHGDYGNDREQDLALSFERRRDFRPLNKTTSSISANHSMMSMNTSSQQSRLSASTILAMIAVMWVCTDTAYSFVYVNITNVQGNVFVNCIILGAADTFSNIFSGFLMQIMPEDSAFQVTGFIGLVFSLLLPYAG